MSTRLSGKRSLRSLTSTLLCVLLLLGVAPTARAALSSTPEQSWTLNGRVFASQIVGDTVYVAGDFSEARSRQGEVVDRRNVAAFSVSTGELRRDFRVRTSAQVRSLATDGQSLYLGGWFGWVNGTSRGRIARVSLATGQLHTEFVAHADRGVLAMEYLAGELYVGGAFTEIGGAPRPRLAKLHPITGAVDTGFNARPNDEVLALVKSPGSAVLYVGGRFTSLGGASRTGVGAVSSTTGGALPPVFADTVRAVLDLTLDATGTRLFGALGAGLNNITAWATSTGARRWHIRVDGDVQAVEYHGGHTYFGFHDGYQGDSELKLLAADAETGALTAFEPRFDRYWGVYAIAASPDGLVAGGDFTRVSGVPAQGFVRFVGDPGSDHAPTPPPPPPDDEPGSTDVTYIAPSAAGWRYWDGGPRPPGWAAPEFDDSSWRAGPAELGYGDGDEATVIGFGPSSWEKYMASYFRMSFTAEQEPVELTLRLLADDGAVVYLNGHEVARDNMPAGTVDGATAAASGRWGNAERAWRSFSLNPSQVVAGTNVLAVEVHQDQPTSSDLSMDAELLGVTQTG
ncbi:delta-60 repeat domain-containing protein [Ornithinicoccus halotolerans]|uniref:delta-60 repeat domain-containing protein n=1 Tax=Ornithinicoccus halotolerans TaxID=1748220 RepID=UPI00129489CB|nr:delta-60 repeat domain-containing protein [Ornithinicoccus halotolerans]